jgi:hypothetical protein
VDAIMERVQPVLMVVLRISVGSALALTLSVIGIGIGWGIFVFSGAESYFALLTTLMTAAGIGAGLGGALAWLRLDGDTFPTLSIVAVIASLAGVAGAMGGFEYGAVQDEPCCAMPSITPMSYTAFGATVAANIAALLASIARNLTWRRLLNRLLPEWKAIFH